MPILSRQGKGESRGGKVLLAALRYGSVLRRVSKIDVEKDDMRNIQEEGRRGILSRKTMKKKRNKKTRQTDKRDLPRRLVAWAALVLRVARLGC